MNNDNFSIDDLKEYLRENLKINVEVDYDSGNYWESPSLTRISITTELLLEGETISYSVQSAACP